MLYSVLGNTPYINEIKYNKFERRSFVRYNNQTSMTYEYDPNTELLDIYTVKDINNTDVLNYDYNFDQSGNLLTLTDRRSLYLINRKINYNYDLKNRLFSAEGRNKINVEFSETYTIDSYDRITEKNINKMGLNKVYNFNYSQDTHIMTSINVTDPKSTSTINFTYDDYGNMTNKQVESGSVTIKNIDFTYDNDNRMTSYSDGSIIASYAYDNKGQRIKKIVNDGLGTIKTNIYVNGFYTIDDGEIDKHISDGQGIIATKFNNIDSEIKYYHSNHIGSTAAITDNNGLKFQKYFYYPYGGIWQKESTDDTDITHLFIGQELDKESGLYYLNARYYDPDIGMFLRPDPAMDGLNHYAYSSCNPVMYSDPTGMGWTLREAMGFWAGICYANAVIFIAGAIVAAAFGCLPAAFAGVGTALMFLSIGNSLIGALTNGDIPNIKYEGGGSLSGPGTVDFNGNWDPAVFGNQSNQSDNNYDNNTLNNSVNQAGTGTENERAIAESSPNNSVENIYRGKASEISGIKLFGYGDVKSTLAANPDLAKKLTVGGIGFENVSCHFLSLVNSLKLLGANIDLKSSLQALIDNSGGFRTGQLITNPRSFMNAVLTANNVAATSKYEVISNPGNNYTSLISSGNSALIRGSDIHHSNYQFYNNGSWYQVNSTGYLQAAGFVSNPSYIGIISLNWK